MFFFQPSSDTNFAQIIEKNVVPRTFLYMVLTQFVLIMIDRYLILLYRSGVFPLSAFVYSVKHILLIPQKAFYLTLEHFNQP